MGAVILTVGLFLYWTLVGVAVNPPQPGRRWLEQWLLAPVTGLCVLFIPVYILNRYGIAIDRFAVPLTVVLGLAAMWRVWRHPPLVEWRQLRVFAALAFFALAIVAWPMLLYGFDWLSVYNHDMTWYCLSAQELQAKGFFEPPDVQQLLEGKAYYESMWFFYAAGGIRAGVNQVLAWTMSLTGLAAPAAYMPLMVAFHVMLVMATAGLATVFSTERRTAIWAGLLTACSALTAMGTIKQLLGQVPGIALLLASVAMLLRPLSSLSGSDLRRHGMLTGLYCTSLALLYPEAAPFLVCGYALYIVLHWSTFLQELRPRVVMLAYIGGWMGIVINVKIVQVYLFLSGQTGHSLKDRTIELFKYFRVPSGLPKLWGLMPMFTQLEDPLMSVLIAIGAMLTIGALVASVVMARRGEPGAVITVVAFAVGIWLFSQEAGFGLMKLAMFIQPFLLAAAASSCFALLSPWRAQSALLGLLVLGLPGLYFTLDHARCKPGAYRASYTILNPSELGLQSELQQLARRDPNEAWFIDSRDRTLTSIVQIYAPQRSVCAPVQIMPRPGSADPVWRDVAWELYRPLSSKRTVREFDLKDADGRRTEFHRNDLARPAEPAPPGQKLLASSRRLTLLNGRRLSPDPETFFELQDWNEVRNHLLLQASSLGESWGPEVSNKRPQEIGVYDPERDVTWPDRRMCGLGRFAMFEVLHPTDTVRLMMTCTSSFAVREDRKLPAADAVGDRRVPMRAVGSGSARIISEPFKTQEIDGRHYVAFDLNMDGEQRVHSPSGLMSLYGRNVAVDDRCIAVHLRDLSLISESDYEALAPPQRLTKFPDHLAHPDLEFSGIYEHGWLSRQSFFRLRLPKSTSMLVVRGVVPAFTPEFTTEITVRLDGREISRRILCPGEFVVEALVPQQAGLARIDVAFSRDHQLGPIDTRQATCRLQEIGFVELDQARDRQLKLGPAGNQLSLTGVTADGWLTREGGGLLLTPRMLSTQSAVILSGPWPTAAWKNLPGVSAEMWHRDGRTEPVQAVLSVVSNRYELRLAYAPRPENQAAVLRFSFDRGFEPQNQAGRSTQRELVAQAPVDAIVQAVTVMGGTPDGWISNRGVTLQVPGDVIRNGTQVALAGRWETGGLPEPPVVHAELYLPGEDAESIPATLQVEGTRYRLITTWGQRECRGDAEIRLEFESDFSFAERKPGNKDARRLVTRMPDDGQILR